MACLNSRLGVYSEGQAIKDLPEHNEESYPQANTASNNPWLYDLATPITDLAG